MHLRRLCPRARSLLVIGLLCPPASLADPPDASTPADAHARMLAALQQIAEHTPQVNPWLGRKALDALQREYAELPADAGAKPRFKVHFQLAREAGHAGHDQQAIKHWKAAYDLLPELPGASATVVQETTYRLGLAYLRWGESENCCRRHSPRSCILPLRGGGIHSSPEGSTQAMKYFLEVLQNSGGRHLEARWLLNIAAMTLAIHPDGVPSEYRIPLTAFAPSTDFPQFDNIAPALQLNAFNLSGGTVVDDFDGDGDLDILTSTWDPAGPLHFYVNAGNGTFEDRTQTANLAGLTGGLNMVQADYNNDGHTDVLVLRGAWLYEAGLHPNSLLHNNGDGTFRDVTFSAGLGREHHPTQTAAWADYDNDGDLDLYVGNEPPADHVGGRSQLFRNNGDGTFSDVAAEAGITNGRCAKGVVWGDYNADRLPDLYVSNLEDLNRLYRNNGDGTFSDVAPQLNVTQPRDSFPTWFWDFDNDGLLDIFVPSYRSSSVGSVAAGALGLPHQQDMPHLYRGMPGGRFEEVAAAVGLTRLAVPMGCNFGDLDNDGYLDFYLGTGYPDYEALMPNVMYHNRGGRRFVDVSASGGFGHLQKGHGIAFADLDHDGDQDIYAQMGGAFRGDAFGNVLFENPGFKNHWLTVQLVGRRSNRSAIGARIGIEIDHADGHRRIYKHVNSGGSFGANPLRQTIGLGSAVVARRLEIFWPASNHTQVFHNVRSDQIIRVTEFEQEFERLPLAPFRLGAPAVATPRGL